jgi:hypothetical protein
MKTRRRPAEELRTTIDSLPLDVRKAVLDGIKRQRIIAGAHADESGGVCPMVAADVSWRHINPAAVERAQEAARAWDRYADATQKPHPATKRQLLALRAMLEASILEDSAATEMPLSKAIAEHEHSRRAGAAAGQPAPMRPRHRRDTGERDRTSELRERGGWSWLRPFRNYDDYEEALRALSALTADVETVQREPLAR